MNNKISRVRHTRNQIASAASGFIRYPISMVVHKNGRLIDGNAGNVSDFLPNPKSGNILFEKIESTGKLSWILWAFMAVVFINIMSKLFFQEIARNRKPSNNTIVNRMMAYQHMRKLRVNDQYLPGNI